MNYNVAKEIPDGNSVVRVRAQVMMRDDSTGGWVPMGGGGLSNVSVRKRKIHHEEMNDQPCKHEYLIYGRRISDQSVVLQCTIKKDFEYNKVMPTFHHWKTGNKKFGLTFQTAADARAFDKGVRLAIEDLLDGISEASPLHQYNLSGDQGDDEVFMQLELPVDKNDSRSSAFSSYASGRSPSPSQLLESLDPVVTSGNSTFPTVSNHPSFVHQKPQQPQGRPMMQTHRNSPPNTKTINAGKLVNKEATSSSAVGAFQDHNYYHIQYPLNESPITPKTMQSSPGDTHSHLHFPSKNLLQSLSSANNNFSSNGNSNGNPTSLSSNTVTNKQTELLQAEEYQKTAKTLMSDSSEILVKGSPATTNMTSLNEPPLQQHIKGQIKDKDYSYVKFMRREPPHEYSYPKLPIDPTANINVTTSTTTTLNSSTTTTSGIPVMPSCVGKTDPIKFPQVRNETEDSKSQSSGVKDSPSSSNGSQSGVSGGNWARIGNNNGSRYKVKSHEHTPGEVDDKNLASINDYTAYLVKPSESVGSLYQLEKNTTGERNSLVGSCCSGSDSSCSGDSKKSCTKKHNHNRQKSEKSKGGFKSCSSGKSHSHHYQIPSSQTQFTSELESKSGKSAVYSPGGTPRSSGIPGCPGSLLGGPGGSPTNAMTLTCAHCRESFSADDNRLGDCADAPSLLRKGIETMTCLSCAQALLYHCMSDTEGDYVHPCECSNADGHAVRRWIGLTLLSVLVPCLCCYVPLISCYRCGELCNVCGGRHEASDS